jgi:hypothetical protein
MFEGKGKNTEVERPGGGRRRAAAPLLDDWNLPTAMRAAHVGAR